MRGMIWVFDDGPSRSSQAREYVQGDEVGNRNSNNIADKGLRLCTHAQADQFEKYGIAGYGYPCNTCGTVSDIFD